MNSLLHENALYGTPQIQSKHSNLIQKSKTVQSKSHNLPINSTSIVTKTPAAVIRSRGLKDITNKTPAAPTTTGKLLKLQNVQRQQIPLGSSTKSSLKQSKSSGSSLRKLDIPREEKVKITAPVIDDAEIKEQEEDFEIEYMPPSVNWDLVDESSLKDELEIDADSLMNFMTRGILDPVVDDNSEDEEKKIADIVDSMKTKVDFNCDDDLRELLSTAKLHDEDEYCNDELYFDHDINNILRDNNIILS